MRDSGISNKERLQDIVSAIAAIEDFMKCHTRNSFLDSFVTINATLFQFAIIGEAIVNVDDEILRKYAYPWYKVRSFRNFILHEYHSIEFRIVWETARKDLPELRQVVTTILQQEF